MADTKISAGADPGTVVATDKVPMARSASTTAYAATMAEIASYANGAYAPVYAATAPLMDGTAAPGTAAAASRGDHVHPTNTALLSRSGGTMTGALVLAADPTAPLQAATRQYVDGSAPAGGPYVAIATMHDVGRNYIHNPLFAVAQRGAGPFTTSVFTLDRWSSAVGGSTMSITQTALTDADRAAIGDEAARVCLQCVATGTAGAGDYIIPATQSIEDVSRLSGKTVILSFWAKANAGTPKFGIDLYQGFGSGGSPSANVKCPAQAVTLSTTWTRYTTVWNMPSTSGKTLGTTPNTSVTVVQMWMSSGTTNNADAGGIGVQSYTLSLWGLQLEVGSVATPLEKPDPQQDLAKCQRYFQYHNGIMVSGAVTGTTAFADFALPVTMRAAPTVLFDTISYSSASGLGLNTATASHLRLNVSVTATATAYGIGNIAVSADL